MDVQSDKVDVVVIGAGAAGLAAAWLLQRSRAKVVVVEARDRVGGRVWTDRTSFAIDGQVVPIDIGASWIHGTMGNPVTDLRDEFSIKTMVTEIQSRALYASGGERLSEKAQAVVEAAAEQVVAEIDRPSQYRAPETPLQPIVEKAIARTGLKDPYEAGVRFFLYEHFENEWGAGPRRLSSRWYKDTRFEGEQEVFPDGYDAIFTNLATQLTSLDLPTKADLRLGSRVTSIGYDDQEVSIRIDGQQAPLRASYAIVTLPLGVLQRGSVGFAPGLPAWKTAAIDRLQMGTLSKTWMLFERTFWDPSVLVHGCLGSLNKWSSWYSFREVAGRPILLALNGGYEGRQIEAMADVDIQAEAIDALRRCFGKGTPAPTRILQSRWATDEFCFGSYSHVPLGASVEDRDDLADPVGRLLFAGEATHRTCSQTVHGALLSGYREARRVLRMLNLPPRSPFRVVRV